MDNAIYDNGKVADVVVLDNVTLDKSEGSPLSDYIQPAFFTIVELHFSNDCRDTITSYLIRDSDGAEFDVSSRYGWYLVRLVDWVENKEQLRRETIKHKENKIIQLQYQLDILKEILTNQGIRIVKESQAKELGLTTD